MKEKNSGCDIENTVVKFSLSDDVKKAFCMKFKEGIYKELRKQDLLTVSQLSTLLHN